ncbi:hypothetical protein FACS1894172_01250 [Spirochaetia bacterium]|nr:hypothetical protein FACS1894172_01250 [Spirochaetia bacterium]
MEISGIGSGSCSENRIPNSSRKSSVKKERTAASSGLEPNTSVNGYSGRGLQAGGDTKKAVNFLTFWKTGWILFTMNLKTILSKETINLHLKGTTKEEIIKELLGTLVAVHHIPDPDAALAAILEREEKMSTGMKHGIAIPHGKSTSIKDLIACIGISDNPVDFDALDKKPCRIFIMTLSPIEQTGPHLQFLAEVSLLFKSPEKRLEILEASTPEDVLRILSE